MKNYATFWQRFAAVWIDIFILLPLMVGQAFAEANSKDVAFALVIPMGFSFAAYSIFCHALYGQTVGKRVMGIRVVRTTGVRIGWREALLRSSIDVCFAILAVIGAFVALSAIDDADYYGVEWIKRVENLAALHPAWLSWTGIATQIWVWSEFVVMLLNERRRALHDFIAGTIVLSDPKISEVEDDYE